MSEHLATAERIEGGMGIILKMANIEFLEKERLLHKTARDTGLTECQHCGYCCLRRSCIPLPKEMPAIAKYLGLSPHELARQHMVADIHIGNYCLLWALEIQLDLTGKLLPYNRTYDRGYCHFFDRKTHLCLIYPVRPKSAIDIECWNNSKASKVEPWAKWNIDLVKQFLPDFIEED